VIALPLMLPPSALAEALTHELCHYKARDNWWVLLRCVCCAVHWFNPLVWIGQRIIKTDCELACDERVAARLTEPERLHYVNTLVTTAKRAYAPRAGVLTTGMTMTGKRLKRRVNALIRMSGVKRVAAAILAVLLLILTIAAFSAAESTEQTRRLGGGSSAFPFQATDVYPAPEAVFGEPVALGPLLNIGEAEAQAKRYLRMFFPEDQEIDAYDYEVLGYGSRWQVTVWPPEDRDAWAYSVRLKSGGGLEDMRRPDIYASEELLNNFYAARPDHFNDVMLVYGQQVMDALYQGIVLTRCGVREDMETPEGRYIICNLYEEGSDIPTMLLTLQVAPAFGLNAVEVMVDDENPSIEPERQQLIYTKNEAITFDASYLGSAEEEYALADDAVLTVQQAFDRAVEIMMERSGLGAEEFVRLPLEYSYYDESNPDATASEWYFVWIVDPDGDGSMSRYWVSFEDAQEPLNILYEGAGPSFVETPAPGATVTPPPMTAEERSGSGQLMNGGAKNPPIELAKERLTYTKDATIAFDAGFLGSIDYAFALSPEAVLTVQQAFDMAVDVMLERSGLAKEEFVRLQLEYGYFDKSNFDGEQSSWRFNWIVNRDEAQNRYNVTLKDGPAPDYTYSAPGEGLG
jgi:hypothetical protein